MISRSTINRIFYFLFFFLFLFLLIPSNFINYPTAGLDDSWSLALNLAYKYKMVFGRDFEFTYGPLGIVRTRMPFGVNWPFYLVFDIYFITTQLLVLRQILKRHFNAGTVFFLFLVLSISAREETGSWSFLLSLFYLLSMIRGPIRLSHGIQAALLAVITFYFKASVGVVAVFLYIGILFYLFIRRRLDAKSLVLLLVWFAVCIAAGAWLLRVDLKGYVIGGLHLISGYNDSMFFLIRKEDMALLYVSLVVLAGTAVFGIRRLVLALRERRLLKDLDDLVVYGLITLVIFFYYKSGFTRADHQHIEQLFRGFVLGIGLLYFFGRDLPRWRLAAAIWCWVIVGCSLVVFGLSRENSRAVTRLVSFAFVPERIGDIRNYFTQLIHYRQEAANLQERASAPNPYRDVIGDGTTDIIPWEISTIYFNGLHYDPRPVIQTYSAYDTWLDGLNAAKYASSGGPQYVLLSVDATDGRLAWFDEARTKLELLNRYAYAGRIQDQLLLKKRPASLLRSDGEETITARLGQDIPIAHYDGLRFSRIFIRFSVLGRLRRMVYQSPRLNIVVTLRNGDTLTYAAPKTILEDGLIVNKYLDSKEEFQAMMQAGGRETSDIRSIRIEPDGTSACFKPEITMTSTFYAFELPAGDRVRDSIAVDSLLHSMAPHRLDPSLITPDSLAGWVDLFRHDPYFIAARGWAYRPGEDNTHDTLSLLLQSPDHAYELPTQTGYSGLDVDLGRNMHYSSLIATSHLLPGRYELEVASRRPGSLLRRAFHTRKFVTVPKPDTVYTPVRLAGRPTKDTLFAGWIDSCRDLPDLLVLRGWAIHKPAEVGTAIIDIVLSKDPGVFYSSATATELRTDITSALHNGYDLDRCGFTARISKKSLPPGRYRVGVYVHQPGAAGGIAPAAGGMRAAAGGVRAAAGSVPAAAGGIRFFDVFSVKQ